MISEIEHAVSVIRKGGVIAYPTESVFGLGCDPDCEEAVLKILSLKERAWEKGLILIASDWSQVHSLIKPLTEKQLKPAKDSWPGPYTWVIPARAEVPLWVKGKHDTIAIRITAHPIANELCKQWGKALVSTSANKSGEPPFKEAASVKACWGSAIDYIVSGDVGGESRPTEIRDLLSGEVLRF